MKAGTVFKTLAILVVLTGACIYFLNTIKPTAVVAVAKTGIAPHSVPGTVLVRAAKEMEIRSDLAGRVAQSRLELGMKVEEGEVLLALDPSDVELTIEKVQLEIESADLIRRSGSSRQFDLIAAEERLEDVRRRFELGDASKVEVENRERAVKGIEQAIERELNSMELRIAQLENQLKGLQRQIEKMSIRSPIEGVVTEIYAYRGDLVGAGQMVAKLISLDRVVEVQVSEENFSGVEVGQLARVKFLGYGNETFDGMVSKTLPVANATTQRYTVHLDMDLEREKLFPGLTGESTITLDERENAVIIPASAIVGNRVFVVEDGAVSIRRIEKGYGSMTSVEVRSGLEAGESVIVDQLDRFQEGDQVRPSVRTF